MTTGLVHVDVVRHDVYAPRVAKKEKSRAEKRDKLPDRIADAIRAEVASRGMTRYELAKMVGDLVAPTTIYQFMREEGGLRTEVASVLMDRLGLGISPKGEDAS